MAVLVTRALVLGAVGEAAGAADTAAGTGHALDEVFFEQVLLLLEQGYAAFFDAVADHGVGNEVDLLLLERLRNGIAQAAAAGKDAAEVAGVVQNAYFQRLEIKVAAVDPGLQFFKGQHAIHVFLDAVALGFAFFGYARADENDLSGGVGLLDVAAEFSHGGVVVADVLLEGGEGFFDIGDKAGAAAGGEEALFSQLLGFLVGDHVGAESSFDHSKEAQMLERGNDLTNLHVHKLAGNGGSHYGIYAVVLVVVAFADQAQGVQQEALVLNGAEGALVYAGAAGDALAVVDMRYMILALRNGLHLACALAGANMVLDGAVGADAGALAAVDALVGVDGGVMIVIKADGTAGTDAGTAVCDAAAAVRTYTVAADRALVAGDVDDFHHIGIALVAAHGDLDAFGYNGALLVDAAAQFALGAGGDHLGNVQINVLQTAFVVVTCHLAQNLVFQFLYVCIKQTHDI